MGRNHPHTNMVTPELYGVFESKQYRLSEVAIWVTRESAVSS